MLGEYPRSKKQKARSELGAGSKPGSLEPPDAVYRVTEDHGAARVTLDDVVEEEVLVRQGTVDHRLGEILRCSGLQKKMNIIPLLI